MGKPDERTQYLKIAEARLGMSTHTELARTCGMKTSTLTKRFREPGTATLDEVAAMTRGKLTPEEAWSLLNGGKEWREKYR